MAYYLRQDKKKKGLYLQMYESFWDKEKKQPRSRNIESFGYVSELISDEIPDPVSYYQKYVAEKNREHAASVADETRPRVFDLCTDPLSLFKIQNSIYGLPASLP